MKLSKDEFNDLLYTLETCESGNSMLESIEATIVGLTQPCCNFCDEIDKQQDRLLDSLLTSIRSGT